MQKFHLFFLFVLMLPATLQASFSARHENGYSWHHFQLRQLECDVEVFGLFYETTVTFEIRLTTTQYSGQPQPGNYEMSWDFSLVEGAVITDCWIQPYGGQEFIEAQITDLSSAENLYRQYPLSQPKVLLRHRYERTWNGQLYKRFQMQFSPVTLTRAPKIKIRYMLPCVQRYNARRVTVPYDEFNVYRHVNRQLSIRDHNNPGTAPEILAGYPATSWRQENGGWTTTLGIDYYSTTVLNIAPETADRSFLTTYTSDELQFYQMSIAPPVTPENRISKNILLAVDVTAENQQYTALFNDLEKAVSLSAAAQDSITMLYSAFVPEIYDSSFVPVTADIIDGMFTRLTQQSRPQINTLPHLLKQAVKVFNAQNKSGEIWLLTDARAHSDPPETAMEIISQTLAEAENPVVFRIISADFDYWPYSWLNGKTYIGNDYLYENLARLSWGNFIKLREYQAYDNLDAILDVICPTTSSVEIDAEPGNGTSYSRFRLNQERVNFPLTLPYYEIGLFDGDTPFTANYYGFVDSELFAKDVEISAFVPDKSWPAVEAFWYERYIRNLLLEPQSYATISYIEDLSKQKRILTPYSGFVVPGPEGHLAFHRLSAANITGVTIAAEADIEEAVPENFELSAYPNPFNAATKIHFQIPEGSNIDEIEVRIINLLGQTVRSFDLQVNSLQSSIEWRWDGSDDQGLPAASGVYIVLSRMGNIATQNIRITLVK